MVFLCCDCFQMVMSMWRIFQNCLRQETKLNKMSEKLSEMTPREDFLSEKSVEFYRLKQPKAIHWRLFFIPYFTNKTHQFIGGKFFSFSVFKYYLCQLVRMAVCIPCLYKAYLVFYNTRCTFISLLTKYLQIPKLELKLVTHYTQVRCAVHGTRSRNWESIKSQVSELYDTY